jgi:hypothetical protein
MNMNIERRRNPRYQCAGSACVRIAANEPLYAARIVNLSMGGCLIVLAKPQNLSKDMLVELSFAVNHLPFRVRGQVKTIRHDRMVGFHFPQLRERTRYGLEDLIEELKPRRVKCPAGGEASGNSAFENSADLTLRSHAGTPPQGNGPAQPSPREHHLWKFLKRCSGTSMSVSDSDVSR